MKEAFIDGQWESYDALTDLPYNEAIVTHSNMQYIGTCCMIRIDGEIRLGVLTAVNKYGNSFNYM